MSTRTARIATTIAALVGLIATGCSSSSSQATPSTSPTETTAVTISTKPPTTTTSTTVHIPAPTAGPAPAPAPTPTPAGSPDPEPTASPEPDAPTVSVPNPFFIVNPIDFGLFAARVTSITGPATFRCDDPSEQRVAVRVQWTSVNTAVVDVLIDGIGFDAGGRPNGSTWVILDCGSDHVVTARARAADNSHGLSMSTTIVYDAS